MRNISVAAVWRKQVRTLGGRVDARTCERVLHNGRDTVAGFERPTRGDVSHKHMIRIKAGGPALQIVEQRVANILRQGQPHLVSPLSGDLQRAGVPVDVA